MQTLRVCGRKKLPFAEYSVVKDQPGGLRPPDPRSSLAGPLRPTRFLAARSLAGARRPGSVRSRKPRVRFAALKPRTSITSSLGRCATTAARSRPKPANNQAMDVGEGRPDGLTHSPRTFQRARTSYLQSAFALRIGGQPSLSWLANRSSSESRERRLVENTGLEPVTSWLQTRRSPS